MSRLAAGLLALVACSRGEPPGTEPRPPPSATVTALPSDGPGREAGSPSPPGVPAGTLIKAKLVGHTSLVLKLENDAHEKSVFRAAFREGGTRYRGEIAAYRLGLGLGLGALFAEAIPRALPRGPLRALLSEADRERFDASAIVLGNDTVAGCAERWINDLETPPFEKEPWVAKWKGWLQDGAEIAPRDAALAVQFSNLIVFDYLTGNFDRWSGGNLGAIQRDGSFELRFIDNDGAFLDPMPKGPLAASKQRLLATKRFSKQLLGALRGITDWNALFGLGLGDAPLLEPSVIDGVKTRAAEVLAHAEAHNDAPFP